MVISIILPVYNVDRYLARCLHSIQPYVDVGHQIIIVNDGSTDNSQGIIDAFCLSNPNVISVRQDNKGLSAARNKGLQYATGSYVWFIDSDDYVSDITCNLQSLLVSSPDILVFGRVEEYNTWEVQIPRNIEDVCYDVGKEYLKASVANSTFRTNVWDKIFKKSLLDTNDLTFVEGMLYEDMLFSVCAFIQAQRVLVTRLYPYHYIHYNSCSITKTIRQKDIDVLGFIRLLDDFMARQSSEFNNTTKEYHKLIFNWVSSCLLNKYSWMSLYDHRAQGIFLQTMSDPIFKRSVEYCSMNNVGLRQKIFATLLLKTPTLYKVVLHVALHLQRIKLRIQSH